MSLLLSSQRPHHEASVIYLDGPNDDETSIQVSGDIWTALLEDADPPDSQLPSVLSVSVVAQASPRSAHSGPEDKNSVKLTRIVCWVSEDPNLPTSSFAVPSTWKDRYSLIFHSNTTNNAVTTHSLALTRPPQLSEVFLLALSPSAYSLAQSNPSRIEEWICADSRILRQGDVYSFLEPREDVPNGSANGHERPFSFQYRVLMAEPVLQGVTKPDQTRFAVIPGDDEEPPTEVVEVHEADDGVEDDDDGSEADVEIDESFLAGSVLTPHFAEDGANGAEDEAGGRSPPGTSVRTTVNDRSFNLKPLDQPVDGAADGDEAAVFVRTSDLGRIGVFSGDWAILGPAGSSTDSRLVKAVGDDTLGPPHTACGSPTLVHNVVSPASPSPSLALRPSPFGSHHPAVPVATSATIARIASPHASDRSFQPLFLRALKTYFQGRKRLVKKGDIMAVPIWLEQAKLLVPKEGEDTEDPETEVLDYDFATPRPHPSGVVFFKITNLEYDVLDTTNGKTHGTQDSYVAATMGELGCYVDPVVTKMIQTGLEHSRIPNVVDYFHIANGYASLPRSSRLTSSGTPFQKLRDIVEASLLPAAADYDLPISVLLKGSRGIGKQTVVRWVAQDLGVHVYEINAFEVLGETDVKTEGTLRARFERAAECSPCIFLLRHIEALARTSQTLETGREPPIIPALHECLDDLRKAWKLSGFPIILVATTSDVEHVPLGVLGCFKHEIGFEVPNEPERLDILHNLLVNASLSPDVSLANVATQTAALVAADLVDLVSRTKMASMDRVLKALSESNLSEADITAAGTQLTGADFDVALSKARASYSESIGAPKIPNVSWDDVGGLANVKQDILDTIQLPLEHPELFADGLKKRSGILLYGPPGTGKTLLAKAVATSCSLNFFSVKGPELLNMYIGESEANVRRVFQRARDAKPCVIFFDELDSVAPKRGNHGDSGGVMDRIVSQLLAELDGMADGKGGADVFVIGATNRPDLLDPALLRPGRFDRMLYLGVSDTHGTQLKIIQALTRKFKLDPALDLTAVAEQCPFNYTGADFYALCSDAMLKAMSRKAEEIDATISTLNAQPPPYKHPHPITPQYYLAEMATDAETDVVVSQVDFNAALRELVPSVSTNEMEHYREVQQKFAKDTINSKSKAAEDVGEEDPEPPRWKGKGKAV